MNIFILCCKYSKLIYVLGKGFPGLVPTGILPAELLREHRHLHLRETEKVRNKNIRIYYCKA